MQLTEITDYFGFTDNRSKQPEPPKEAPPDRENLGPKQVFYTWDALARPQQKGFSGKLTRSLTVIGIVVALVLIVMQEFILILVVLSMIFIGYALSKTPPETMRYEVSNYGLMYGDQLYHWSELKQYFFTEQEGHHTLAVDTISALPGRLFVTVYPQDREKLREIFGRYISYLEEEPKTIFDKTYKSVIDKFSLS